MAEGHFASNFFSLLSLLLLPSPAIMTSMSWQAIFIPSSIKVGIFIKKASRKHGAVLNCVRILRKSDGPPSKIEQFHQEKHMCWYFAI